MLTFQTTTLLRTAQPPKKRYSLLRHLHDACAAVNAAHDALRKIKELPEGIEPDVGMSREEILGMNSWQEALPFFMQARADC